jgi:hypothetical protein
MSDILIHAAITENQEQLRKWVKYTIDPEAIQDLEWFTVNKRAGWPLRGKDAWPQPSTCPTMVKCWKRFLSPAVKTHTNGFKVCDASGNFRCGSSCTWCVPPGVTSVQFQLWGHGGGNSGQCCCGGTLFGPTGGYMVSTVPVTPGHCFCLCAGCAFCCWASQTTPGYNATPTWIINNQSGYSVCVDGAIPDISTWRQDLGFSTNNCQIPALDGCGPDSCSGFNFCWDSGNDNLATPHAFSSHTWNVLNAANSVNYGIPGIWPAICIGGSLYCQSCMISGPVFGYEDCTCMICTWASMCDGYGGCYFNAAQGYQQIPAVGGWGGWVCGGYSSGCGDSGGMGMICVSWNCS